MALNVFLADDHQIVRQSVRVVLEREGFHVAGEAANGRDAVRLACLHVPDVAILEFSMQQLNGLEAAQEILRACPGMGILFLTMHTEERQIVAALRAGIRGYVSKTDTAEELTQAIREVASGGLYLSPSVSRVIADLYLSGTEAPPDPLTFRDRQVLQLVAEGKTTKEIATLLDLSAKTAECYRGRLMDKLNIHDTAGLVRYAIRRGMIQASLAWSSILGDLEVLVGVDSLSETLTILASRA